jgi:hypothetical protein
LNEKDWLQITLEKSKSYSENARYLVTLALTFFIISITVINIGNNLADSVLDSVKELVGNQNLTDFEKEIIMAEGELQSRQLPIFSFISGITLFGGIILVISSVFPLRKRMKMTKLYNDILYNRINGKSQKKKDEEILRIYSLIDKKYFELRK